VTSPKPALAAAKAESLAEDLSKTTLSEKGDSEKIVKRNEVAGAVAASAVVAGVSSPNRSASPNVTDDDDGRPQPPDDDSVPDEDSLVRFLKV
jgi:hypothetical protein